ALLNSYSGVAASAAGLATGNTILIVTGLLVGAFRLNSYQYYV
ncbi:NAD(P) transhydrogenase, beta subunit, partial [marine sediment metagenome]